MGRDSGGVSGASGASKGHDAKMRHEALTRALRGADVICTTCIGAGSGMLEKVRFAGVLIDEASQVRQTHC